MPETNEPKTPEVKPDPKPSCGNCCWLHPKSPQFYSDSRPNTPWCWALPTHVQREPTLPPCVYWVGPNGEKKAG